MDIENLNKTIIEKDVADELIWMTVSKYALFMSHGKIGIDAKALYEHYQYTCIMQKTNSVWAADRYCRQGLDWGRDRFEKAKKLLLDLGLIEIKQERDEGGKWSKIYVKVKMKRVELEPSDIDRLPENPQAGKTASGKTATNALTNNINALTNNINASQKKDKDKKDRSSSTNNFLSSFNIFWSMYDKKVNMKKCLDIWKKINPTLYETIYKHTKAYVSSTPDKSWRKDPERYLKHECWNNEIIRKKEQGIEYPEL